MNRFIAPKSRLIGQIIVVGLLLSFFTALKFNTTGFVPVRKGEHIVLLGGNLGSRMMNYGHFETEMQVRYPESLLFIRNMCDPGDTPGFRPRSARNTPWAFPGAEKFQTEYANQFG